MATIVFKPIGNGQAWKHAMINSVTNDRDNEDVYEFKIDHENHKKQIHAVFGKAEALCMAKDLISSLIETGNLDSINLYVKDGVQDLEDLQKESDNKMENP